MFGLSSLLFAACLASSQLEQPDILTQQEEPIQHVEISESEAASDVTISEPQPITFTNAIEPAMLKYKHWTGTYSPEEFTLSLNGTPVPCGQTYTLASADTPLTVQFDYSFMNGIRKGSKKISYAVQKECTQATITFSWLDTWKVLIDNATPIKEEVIS